MKRTALILLLTIAGACPSKAATEPPVPIRTVDPVYPKNMRQKHVSGVVSVSFLVDDHGTVKDAKVEKASDEAFADPALDAVKKWRFKPAERDGNAVAVRVTIPIRFTDDATG